MKKIYAIAFALMGATAASAQITLDQSSFATMPVTTDTFPVISPPYPTLTTGANQFWDFSGVLYENTRYYNEQGQATNPNMPNATWWETRASRLGTHDSLRARTYRWSGITANGFMRIGESAERHAIWLGYIDPGFAATDSMVVLEQDAPYSAPYPLIKFPATYNSSWNASFERVLNMELTYVAQSYNAAPFVWKSATDYTFTVPGFGNAQLILMDGSITDTIDVLLERIGGVTTDSFFVNGAPAPPALLSALGLTQGKVTNTYFSELFRPNETSALVLYTHGNDPNYNTVQSNQVHMDRVPFRVSVESVSGSGNMSLYPNPVGAGRHLTIKLSQAATGNISYKLSQISGKVAGTGTIAAQGNNELQLALPATLANGVYWLTLSDDKGEIAVAPFRLAE